MKTYPSILIALCCMAHATLPGQSFSFHSNSPFGIQRSKPDTTRVAQEIMFADFDADGDLDLFLTGLDSLDEFSDVQWEDIHYFIEMQENTGDASNPQFGPRMELNDHFPYPIGYFSCSAGDINGDSKTDFIVSASVDQTGNQTPLYLRNIGDGEMLEFDITGFDEMEIPPFVPQSLFMPELIDLDGDGDLDVIMSGFLPAFAEENGPDQPVFYYARNTANRSVEPEFEGWYNNPYGLVPNPYTEILTGGDIDNDGDVDLIGFPINLPTDSAGHLYVHLNHPDQTGRPDLSTVLISPYGLPSGDANNLLSFPTLTDLDGDGDLDLFVFTSDGVTSNLAYYINDFCVPTSQDITQSICEGDTLVIGNSSFTEAGQYTIHIENIQHCDSIINLNLSLIETITTSVDAFICEGETYTVGNETFTSSGNYMVYLVTSSGCDSLVLLTLQVNPIAITEINESICDGESVTVGNETYSETGDYMVTLTTSAGCDSTILLYLVVNPNYTNPVQEVLCEGQVYHIGQEELTLPGHYDVLLLSIHGCDSLVSLDLDFVHIDTTVIQLNQTLTANQPSATYQWFNCDTGDDIPGATGQSFEATVSGNYAVRITRDPGCIAESACTTITITGLEDELDSSAITFYPNPTSGLIYIRNTSHEVLTNLRVSSLNGQHLVEFDPSSVSQSLDLSFLPSGVYVMKLKLGSKEVIKRITVF